METEGVAFGGASSFAIEVADVSRAATVAAMNDGVDLTDVQAVLEVMAAVAHVLSFLVLTARTLMGVGTVMTSKNGLM